MSFLKTMVSHIQGVLEVEEKGPKRICSLSNSVYICKKMFFFNAKEYAQANINGSCRTLKTHRSDLNRAF